MTILPTERTRPAKAAGHPFIQCFTYLTLLSCLVLTGQPLCAQQNYFVDGYHGGIWGHFPYHYASYIAAEMQKHPRWKVNLEIEPVTWDSIRQTDPQGYAYIRQALIAPPGKTAMEYVNPAYGQPYLFNISAESIIRQFAYGIRTLKRHFPGIRFTTYSSEEPCFTSALPAILQSFGIRYASLKNPNTCWGGYTAAHGGELVRWKGPDGSSIITVPRYATEQLASGSTWQTNAWRNDPQYLRDAVAYGIPNPVGMCLQDAGWTHGPWLGAEDVRQPGGDKRSTYTTWSHYFQQALKDFKPQGSRKIPEWRLSQEDIHVSLVWGGQILQKVARAVRQTENHLINTEKIAALNHYFFHTSWPAGSLDKAWLNLLLSQHHDCWIVPYNKKHGLTWQQHVSRWTDTALTLSAAIRQAGQKSQPAGGTEITPFHTDTLALRIYNSTGRSGTALMHYTYSHPDKATDRTPLLLDPNGRPVPFQLASPPVRKAGRMVNGRTLYFMATVPAMGYSTYQLVLNAGQATNTAHRTTPASPGGQPMAKTLKDGRVQVETDRYMINFDPQKGGIITRLLLKKREKNGHAFPEHEFITQTNTGIGELRGFFYQQNRFLSSKDQPAKVHILTNGPFYTRIQVEGKIGTTPFHQVYSLSRQDPLIRSSLRIDWPENNIPGIGAYDQDKTFKNEDPAKAFYNSRYKLLTLFPVNIQQGTIYKDAPFDIYKSKLPDTFYDRWDSIKNDIIFHWVNLDETDSHYGFALFSGATTSYAHADSLPLGLVTQYIGRGLFGADYTVEGPTKINYAFMPHDNDWKQGQVEQASVAYNNPFTLLPVKHPGPHKKQEAMLTVDPASGWEISSLTLATGTDTTNRTGRHKNSYILRIFNAVGTNKPYRIQLNHVARQGNSIQVAEVDLNGHFQRTIPLLPSGTAFELSIPPLGFRTVSITYP